MITLDANMYLICSMFNISYTKIASDYSGMSVEEIMKAEAAKGNAEAAKFDASVLTDPVKLIELFNLKDPGNKYAILSNMNQADLDELLPQLEQKDLMQGLNYFNKDKLLKMVEEIPKDQLVAMTFDMFSQQQVMALMPDDQMNKVLQSPSMDKNLEIKYLQDIKPEVLAQMYEAATGEDAPGSKDVGLDGKPNFDQKNLSSQISNFSDNKFQEAMLSIPTANKQEFIYKMAIEDPKIYQMFDASAYTDIMNQKKDKADIIRSSNVISQDQLVKMVAQLPKDLTAAVLTQIDTKIFADELISKYKSILSQVIAG